MPENTSRLLKRRAGPRVLFTGGVYGDGYRELQCHALVLRPRHRGRRARIRRWSKPMGFGNCILVHDVPENREVVREAGLFFDARRPDTLASRLTELAAGSGLVDVLRARAEARAREAFSWDRVTDQYERLFESLS